MNPKAANLDPNLKEAYNRVMGTTVPQPTVSNPAQTPTADTSKAQTQIVTAKNRGKLSPIFIVIAVILFFIVYAIIWAIIFKLKLPFLS